MISSILNNILTSLPLGGVGEGLLYITWNPSVEAFHFGPLAIRWYSLCWLIGLVGAYLMVKHLYKNQKIGEEKFEPLFLYCFIGILVGARLGHCIFYQPDYYFASKQNFIEMLLPIKFLADGSWKFIGYEGLASHGGAIGLMIALALYCRKTKVSFLTVLDNIAIATPITACMIRVGNFFNSEIVGRVTDVPWAVIFEQISVKGQVEPRHPGQMYEAMAYFLLIFIGYFIYRKYKKGVGTGFYFGLCLTYIFTFRFFIEYVKENQVAFENGMPFNMGQLLSVPFIIIGIASMVYSFKKVKEKKA